MNNLKLFGKWDSGEVTIMDPGLKSHISLHDKIVPSSLGRNTNQFWKTRNHIVERLINKIMVPGHKGKKHFISSGHATGKKSNATKLMIATLEEIQRITKENPIKILVKAVENAAPREEITTIEYGGARYPQAVDCSPIRRIDIALRQMVQGAHHKCFNRKLKMKNALADEIIKAANSENTSAAIAKKLELERQADASR